jgi:hypothetical protein
MQRWWPALALVAVVATVGAVHGSKPAAASGVSVKVSPAKGLVNGQSVTVSGRGLPKSGGTAQTWFVTECTAAVRGHVNPATDTLHCNISAAQALKVSHTGTFSMHFKVMTGIIGDGYCGTADNLRCVIGVGTAAGAGTVVPIVFKSPAQATTTTTSKK